MPSRTPANAKPKPLSDNDLEQIAAEIEAGRPPMVWFTAAAVGVTEGRSGKVVSLGDPADGDFLQIRPTGSKDVLSFGPTEVTVIKPQRAAQPPAPKPVPDKKETPVTPAASPSTSASPAAERKPASESPAPAAARTAAPEAKPAAASRTPAAKAAKAPAARKSKAPEVTVTINGTAEGEWTVDVVSGKKRTTRAVPVAGTAVAQAAKLLNPEVSEVVDGLLESVRGAQEAKVQQLQAELEQARKLLEELSD